MVFLQNRNAITENNALITLPTVSSNKAVVKETMLTVQEEIEKLAAVICSVSCFN